MPNNDRYNYSIALLRIIAAVMVVFLHILGHGGAIAFEAGSPNFKIAWLMELAVFGAVNIFALITGYVSCHGSFKPQRILKLWLEALIYSVGLTLVSFALTHFDLFEAQAVGEGFNIITLLKSFIPVISNRWWYFTAYFVLFFFMPFINRLLEALDDKLLMSLCIILLLTFSIMNAFDFFIGSELFGLRRGYSVAHLAVLYIYGAAIRRFEDRLKMINRFWFLGGYVFMVLLMWILKLFVPSVGNRLVNYGSLTTILGAVCLFIFVLRIDIKNVAMQKVVRNVSKTALALYLISDHALIRRIFITDKLLPYENAGVGGFVVRVLLSGVVAAVLCMVADMIRGFIFDRIEGIKKNQ